MRLKVRLESLAGELIHDSQDATIQRAGRGAELYLRMPDDVVMTLASTRQRCVVIGQDKRRFQAVFKRITSDGVCVLELDTAS